MWYERPVRLTTIYRPPQQHTASVQLEYSGTPPSGHTSNAAIYGNADILLGPECDIHGLTYN